MFQTLTSEQRQIPVRSKRRATARLRRRSLSSLEGPISYTTWGTGDSTAKIPGVASGTRMGNLRLELMGTCKAGHFGKGEPSAASYTEIASSPFSYATSSGRLPLGNPLLL